MAGTMRSAARGPENIQLLTGAVRSGETFQSPITANYWSNLLRSQLIGKGGRKHGCCWSRCLAVLEASAQWMFALNYAPDLSLSLQG